MGSIIWRSCRACTLISSDFYQSFNRYLSYNIPTSYAVACNDSVLKGATTRVDENRSIFERIWSILKFNNKPTGLSKAEGFVFDRDLILDRDTMAILNEIQYPYGMIPDFTDEERGVYADSVKRKRVIYFIYLFSQVSSELSLTL